MEKIINRKDEDIYRMYSKVTWGMLHELAEYLDEIGFPAGQHISFEGKSESAVKNKFLWLYYNEDGEPKLQSNLVPDKPNNMYYSDLLNPKFIISVKMSVADAAAKYEQKKEVEDWIEAGKRCVFCYGWEWKGAGYHDISQEEARKLSKKHSFGKGFYTMDWREINGEKVLYFNELSESDML